jgi:hypothetical protein
MIKLTDIVDEIKVRPSLSPQDIIDNLSEFNMYLLIELAFYNTLSKFKEAHGYPNDDLEDLLFDDFGYQGENLNTAVQLIEDYYRTIRPGDVKVIEYTDGKIDINGYKNAITKYAYETDDCYYTILTKF